MVTSKHSQMQRSDRRAFSRRLRLLLVFAALSFGWVSPARAQVRDTSQKKVLVFYLMRRGATATDTAEGIYQKILTEGLAGQLDYYAEYVDLARFSEGDYQGALRDFLQHKYRGTDFDLIIANADLRNFLARYGSELFPGTPVVFSMSRDSFDDTPTPKNFAGNVYDTDRKGTLDIILKLQPSTKRVFVIAGASKAVDQWHEVRTRQQFSEWGNRLEFTYWSGLPLDDLKARLSNLPADSVIYYVMMTEDGAGKRFVPNDALDQIVEVANVPVYSWTETTMGHGIVGGKLHSTEVLIEQTAKLALRVLHGERPEDIPLAEINANRLEFDWRQLRRWKIDEGRLPAGATVLFRETTFWQRYRSRIIGVVALFALQSALILTLLFERRRRRNAIIRLKESEEHYRNVVDTQTELICRFLPDTTLTFVNEAYCKYFGKTSDELIGTKFIVFLPESERARSLRYFESLVEHSRSGTQEHLVIRPGGRPGWQQWTNYVISERASAPVELQGVGHDVTERKLAEDALRASEERFTKVFTACPQPMSLTTLKEGRYVYVNDRFLEMSGYRNDEVIGHTSVELRIWETTEHRRRVVDRLLSSGSIHNMETKFRIKSGELRVLLSSVELLQFDGEHFLLVASSDITERQQLQQQLVRSERDFSTLVENSPDVISRLDQDLRYIYVSPNLERVTGVATGTFIGKTPAEVAVADFNWSEFESNCREAFFKKQTIVREFQFRGRHYRTRIIPELSFGGVVESVMSITEDFTERLRAERELRELTARLISLQDEERRRIARELHDGAVQNILAISFNLESLRKRIESQVPQSAVLMRETQQLVEQSLTELRTLSYLLHPPILDHAGLALALQLFVEGFSKRSGIQVDINVPQDTGRMAPEVETALFRVVQESLNNIRRHSGSATAKIRLEKGSKEVRLAISDAGHGMSKNDSKGGAGENTVLGVGISGMRQRLLQLGGRLDIESSNNGTTVTAVLPFVEVALFRRQSSA